MTQKMRLSDEIKKRAHHLEPQGDGVWMVLIRMDEIEAAVQTWDKARRDRAKMFKRQALNQKFR